MFQKDVVQDVVIPEPEMYTAPKCQVCSIPFEYWQGRGTSYEQWRQTCSCLKASSVQSIGPGYNYYTETFRGELIGTPKYEYCWLCGKPMYPGEEAKYGDIFVTFGYAHPQCYEERKQDNKRIQQDAERAKASGIHVGVQFSIDAFDEHTKIAPNTGHDDHEGRKLPFDLPDVPQGIVTYSLARRPMAVVRLEFPDMTEAETWWEQAIAIANASYYLSFHTAEQKEPLRRFQGPRFSHAVSYARWKELSSEPEDTL